MNENAREATRKERRDARKSLLSLLKRLRRACGALDQIGDWYDMVNDVESVLHQHGRSIPAAQRGRIKDALQLPEETMAAAGRACQVLQVEVEKSALAIGGTSAVAGIVLTTVLVTTLIAAAAILGAPSLADRLAVDVHIYNQGCEPFNLQDNPLAGSPILSLVGLDLPPAIASGGDGIISVPPLPLEVDNAADRDILFIGFPGPIPDIPIPVQGAADIRFNGQPLIGTQRTINLADLNGANEHTLVVSCN